MRPGKFLLLAAAVVSVLVITSAGAKAITLSEAVKIAMEKNHDVLSAREELVKAEGLVKVARGSFYPSVSAGAEATTREKTPVRQDSELYGADLTLEQSIYEGGRLRAYRAQADYNTLVALNSLSSVEQQVAYQVYEGFYSILHGEENVKTAEEALAYAENYALEMRKRREVGLATDLEVTRAEQLLVTSRKELVRAQNELESARVELARLLRLPDGRKVTADGQLEYVPVDVESRDSVGYALENSPDLEVLRQEVKMQEKNIDIARSDLRPSVSMSASWQFDDPATGITGDRDGDDTWSVRIRADFPLFDSGITKGKVEQEQATLRQSERSVEKRADELRSGIKTIILELDTAENNVMESIKNLELARESLRLAEVGVREGVGIQLDVLDARRSLTQARLSWASAVMNYELKAAELRKAEGRLVSWLLDNEEGREE
jgi:outer membrane protein TolC